MRFASQELREDREVVLAAVVQDGTALEFADKKFLEDREVVLQAVASNGMVLKHLGQELRNDPEVLLALNGRYRGILARHLSSGYQRAAGRVQELTGILARHFAAATSKQR